MAPVASSSSYRPSSATSSALPIASSSSSLSSFPTASPTSISFTYATSNEPQPLLSHTNNLILDIVVPVVAVLVLLAAFIFFRRARRASAEREKTTSARGGFVEMEGSPHPTEGVVVQELEKGDAKRGGWARRESS